MSFADLVNKHSTTKGPRCAVGKILAGVDPEFGDEIEEVMAGAATSGAIVAALEESGWLIGESSVARHRRGACRCGK